MDARTTEIHNILREARMHGLTLDMCDIVFIGGEATIDGIDPYEWMELMCGCEGAHLNEG